MKRLAYLLTAVLIVPHTSQSKFIQAAYFDVLIEQNCSKLIAQRSTAVLKASNIA